MSVVERSLGTTTLTFRQQLRTCAPHNSVHVSPHGAPRPNYAHQAFPEGTLLPGATRGSLAAFLEATLFFLEATGLWARRDFDGVARRGSQASRSFTQTVAASATNTARSVWYLSLNEA